ncbi:MAG TPA: 6-hydroxymethylpterin diphosphokinase MptE-like protein, partial [Candidatus Glassbacteria bacterium]|nr:6-hydroxymethylpterin diphosphokinase MptE-like protein [Candidatus Glassbacteria bacterium]
GEKESEVPRHFSQVFRVVSLEGVSIISHPASVKLCGEYFNVVDDSCRKWIITVGGNFLTNVVSVRTYMSNTLDNVMAIVDNPPVIRLFGKFRKIPGIVISAGPSLDRNIATLKLLEKHAVLICVDTALGPLYRSGVHPHLVLAGDSSEVNLRHLQGVGHTGAALVAEPMTHPRIVSEFNGKKFIMSFNEILMKKLTKILGLFGRVQAWGSISTGAFDLARKLGCNPIVFVGQDLAFTGGRYYAHGTYQEQRWLRELSWPEDLDDVHRWRMSKENDLNATDIFGRPVRTSRQLEAYLQYFETEISETVPLVLNASEGGTGFHQVENVPLESVLWRYARKEKPVRQIIDQAHAARSSREISRVIVFLQSVCRELETVHELCNQGFELTRKLHRNESRDPQADYREVEAIYARVYECSGVREILENATQGGILTFQRGSEKLKDRNLDRKTIEEAAQLYSTFFISFFQTVSLLKRKFGQAAISVGYRLSSHAEEKLLQAV